MKLGFTEEGDHDPDQNIDKTVRCESREQAEAKAREVYPQDQYGSVRFWESEFVAYDENDAKRYPHAGFWECISEPEWYEGE